MGIVWLKVSYNGSPLKNVIGGLNGLKTIEAV